MTPEYALTAAELIAELSKLPPETVVYTREHDEDMSFDWGISGVAKDGGLIHADILRSGDLSESFYDREDDELECGNFMDCGCCEKCGCACEYLLGSA
jgi:hypothetical protein